MSFQSSINMDRVIGDEFSESSNDELKFEFKEEPAEESNKLKFDFFDDDNDEAERKRKEKEETEIEDV